MSDTATAELEPYVDALPTPIEHERAPQLRRRDRPDYEGLWRIAQRIAYVPEFVPARMKDDPNRVFATLLWGDELDMMPMQSLRSIYIIDGTPSVSAEALRGLILMRGHTIELVERTAAKCIVRGRRRGEQRWHTVEWTMDRARRAKLATKRNWIEHPDEMLYARATSQLARELFPDVTMGMALVEVEQVADDDEPTPGSVTLQRAEAPQVAPSAPAAVEQHTDEPEPLRDAPEPPGDELTASRPSKAPDDREPVTTTPPPVADPETGEVVQLDASTTASDSSPVSDDTTTTPPGAGEADDEGDDLARARRGLHAQMTEAFPEADRRQLDAFRHALAVMATRTRPDGPVASSTQLTLDELWYCQARLNDVKANRLAVTERLDGMVVFAAGPWEYTVDNDTPSVAVRRTDEPT